jgi:hypothetical protein
VLIRSDRHAERVLREFVTHYNQERPHRAIDLERRPPTWPCSSSKVGTLSSELTVSAGCSTSTASPLDPALAKPVASQHSRPLPLSCRDRKPGVGMFDGVGAPSGKHFRPDGPQNRERAPFRLSGTGPWLWRSWTVPVLLGRVWYQLRGQGQRRAVRPGLRALVHRYPYMSAALQRLRAVGYSVIDEDVARLSPFVCRHLNVHGKYSSHLPELPGGLRAMRGPDTPEDGQDEVLERDFSSRWPDGPCLKPMGPGANYVEVADQRAALWVALLPFSASLGGPSSSPVPLLGVGTASSQAAP